MHSLFWKIFLSFWVALILFTVATVMTASVMIEKKRHDQLPPRQVLQRVQGEAQSVADAGGEAALKRWLRQLDQREAVPFLLLDDEGRDLLGRALPDYLERPLQAPAGERFQHRRRWPPMVHLTDGRELRLIADFSGITLQRVLTRPRVIALPFIVAALVSGLVCFLLARYLTGPIKRLRAATEQYARGDLQTRVNPSLGRRRDEIADLARAFDRMAERLEGLIHSHKQLLRDVSHELRTPLARMQVALELARRQSGRGNTSELARIEREAERLDELIGRLLSLARLEAQERPLIEEAIDMGELLTDIIEDARFEASSAGRDLALVQNADLELNADPGLLHSAVENLVRNAIRHTAEGTRVEVSLRPDPAQAGWLRLEIRDHGPGVSEQLLPRLFQPFVRADEDRSRDSGGYGLGLAIAERVIKLHRGTVSAENARDGGGLRVLVRLPCR